MPQRTGPLLPWLRSSRRIGFVLATLLAFGIDLLLSLPAPGDRDGHHWTAFGGVELALSEYVLGVTLVYAALLWRNRRPLVVLAVMTAVTAVLWFASPLSQPAAGLLLALYTVAATERSASRARAALALAAGTLTALVAFFDARGYDWPVGALLTVAVTVVVYLLGRRENRIAATTETLRGELEHRGQEAAAQERLRIARELHDILAHSVSAMMMQAAGARAVSRALGRDQPPDPRLATVEESLTRIETVGSQSMRELHRLLGALRDDDAPTETEDTQPQPGIGDIEHLVEVTRHSGLVVQLHRSGRPVALDPSVRLAGYRVAQESLANAMKHAGRGAVVDIYKSWQPDRLHLQVRSRSGHDGTRSGTPGSGTGLVGLRERVELVGGTFESGWVGEEFVTTAVLPLTPRPPGQVPAAIPARAPGGSAVPRPGAA